MTDTTTAAATTNPRLLRPDNRTGLTHAIFALLILIGSLWLSRHGAWWSWLIGQGLLAVSLLQWFALLHEAGHGTLFRSRAANYLFGHMAGFLALIPYTAWRPVHAQHHRWTGWQDVDPTTQALAPRERPRYQCWIVNACWALWIPLFSVLYRAGNYWDLPRLWRMFPDSRLRQRILACAVLYIIGYSIIVVALGPRLVAHYVGMGLYLSLIAQDLLILSQHTHIPMRLSGGEPVKPFPAREQEVFTRSLVFPRWFSRWILIHLDAHELHHAFPRVPGYHLATLNRTTPHGMPWWRWVWRARLIRGEVLLFQNRDQTGYSI